MPDRPRPSLGLAVVLAILLLSGCGTTSTPSAKVSVSTPRGGQTKARFIAQAEAICRTLSAQEQPLKARQESLKQLPTATAEKAFVSLAHQVVVISRAANNKLHALPRPPDDVQAIEKLLAGFSEEVAETTGIANAAVSQESSIGEAAERALKKSIATNSALADEYGIKGCTGSE